MTKNKCNKGLANFANWLYNVERVINKKVRNIIGEEDIFVKYLKPEMDIVEFDESVLTDVNINSNLDGDDEGGNTELPI